MNDKELRWLAETAQGKSRVIELGSWHGRSTTALLTAAEVIAVDQWTTESGLKWDDKHTEHGLPWMRFWSNLRAEIATGKVLPYVCDLQHKDFRACLLRDFEATADMVFIDADHSREAVTRDIKLAMKLVKPGGLVCGHDYGLTDWPGVTRAVDAYAANSQDYYAQREAGTIWSLRLTACSSE
jgi:predicted O-methyltransferase YrrM